MLVSIHSAGCVGEVLDVITEFDRLGFILHWFAGDQDQAQRALDLGCYFSVNSMMKESVLDLVPIERLLPETDFPARNRRGGSRPGDSVLIENIVAQRMGSKTEDIRRQWYRNLRRLSLESGAIDRLSKPLADLLILQSP